MKWLETWAAMQVIGGSIFLGLILIALVGACIVVWKEERKNK